MEELLQKIQKHNKYLDFVLKLDLETFVTQP